MSIKKNLERLNNFTKFGKWTELFDRKNFDKLDDEQHLFKKKKHEYDGNYVSDLLDQYKMYVNLTDRINERIQQSQSFFLSINTFAVGALGYTTLEYGINGEHPDITIMLLVASVLATVFSVTWSISIVLHRKHRRRRFKVINLIEERLPLALFYTETKLLESEGGLKLHFIHTRLETIAHILLVVVYLTLVFYLVDFINCCLAVQPLY